MQRTSLQSFNLEISSVYLQAMEFLEQATKLPRKLAGFMPQAKYPTTFILEQNIIQLACCNPEYNNWPLCSIYYQLLRDDKIHCGKSTFYKYCRLMDITRRPTKKPKNYEPIFSSGPLKVLHQDITVFKTMDNVKHYVYVIRDNFSRAILACNIAKEYSSEIAKQTLESVLQKFDIVDKSGKLITDGGVENKGALTKWLKEYAIHWKKIIAQVDIIQSNSMLEAVNKILKYRYLYIQPIAETEALIRILKQAVVAYNNIPNNQLYGMTPNEVLKGAIPDKHRFKTQIRTGKKNRIIANRLFDCDISCKT